MLRRAAERSRPEATCLEGGHGAPSPGQLIMPAAAGQVMRVTQSLARSGMTVCATIHCPPPHTFALFDRLLVLQRGRVVYFGGNGPVAAAYFMGLPAKARRSRTPHIIACLLTARQAATGPCISARQS